MPIAGTLAVSHGSGSSPAAFTLIRLSDGNVAEPVTIPSPYEFQVKGHANSNLMRELRWYLEGFLEYPFPPETLHAEDVLDALKGWGTQAFNELFGRRDAANWLANSGILQIRSDDPEILSWPWEALFDPQANYLAHERQIERRLNKVRDPKPLRELPSERVNILLLVARPYQGDVRYRSIARPLIELIRSENLPANVHLVRPPTFDQLRKDLQKRPGHYHVLHFDGHGAYGGDLDGGPLAASDERPGGILPHQYEGRQQGCLIFEDKDGKADKKSARDLSTLLGEYAVPAVVLNACQSAMLDASAEGPFASVATALLQSGMRSVVAMAYSLYVSGAQVFLPAFYRRLFEAGSVAEAVRAGRQQMLADKKRVCARGRYPLDDWLLPVLYQQDPLDFQFAQQAKAEAHESRLPEDIRKKRDPYGFIGRDGVILEMERALHCEAPAILVQGLGGVGKTTLARGFLQWLDDTDGLDGALWFDFRDIRSAGYVIDQTGVFLYGAEFRVKAWENKLEQVAETLGRTRVLIVWDNFESAATNLTPEDREKLGKFLDAIRGGRSKVILTSRSSEAWLSEERGYALPLRGLDGEERWEYCDAILRELRLNVDRDDPELQKLMDQLAGHPLAMRVTLPKLRKMPAAALAKALRTNIAALGLSEDEEQGQLFATLRFVEQGLEEDLQPLLELVALHVSFMDAEYLEAMARQVDASWTRERIDGLMTALAVAGLVWGIGGSVYEIHPLLTSYLHYRDYGNNRLYQRTYVEIMGLLANAFMERPFYELRIPFLLHGANLSVALELADTLCMDYAFAELTQQLARYAQESRNFAVAFRLFKRLASHRAVRIHSEGEASVYHSLGNIAYSQRNFAAAREWALKCLAVSQMGRNQRGVAMSYLLLGQIAQEQWDFMTAEEWYFKALSIHEEMDDLERTSFIHGLLGLIAQERWELAEARERYLKSLAIEEKLGRGGAAIYHSLGNIAYKERNFAAARESYLKSLAIKKQEGNERGVATSYHQLGMTAREQRNLTEARDWYLKSLAISEKESDQHGSAATYHELGSIAHLEGNLGLAREWYMKALAITVTRGFHEYSANNCYCLGLLAQKERDLAAAEDWYHQSIAIREKLRDLLGAAEAYGQLGIVVEQQGRVEEAGRWIVRSVDAFKRRNDERGIRLNGGNFFIIHERASPEDKRKLEAIWREAGLGDFPTEQNR